jgi:ubiquitin-like domain-containing CTD phosphatase 1
MSGSDMNIESSSSTNTSTDPSNKNDTDVPLSITLLAKWGKEKMEIIDLSPDMSIAQIKDLICEQTKILPKRQKLIGLVTKSKKKLTDDCILSELKSKAKATINKDGKLEVKLSFILMGTPEENIFIDPADHDNLPDVVDDFELEFNAGSEKWIEHVAKGEKLKQFTESTIVHVMNAPRTGKPLMVLDLDHTLLDFSRKSIEQASNAERAAAGDTDMNNNSASSAGTIRTTQETIDQMKRPFMDDFLARAYASYDLVVWSQTSWRWLETKMIELGMLTNNRYKFCFVLDKTSMFTVTSTLRTGERRKHAVKPLQIIWNKFPNWTALNTVHLDDLSRNFALNPHNGLKVTAYYRKKKAGKRDVELLGLATYLVKLAAEVNDFTKVKFKYWTDVVAGKMALQDGNDSSNVSK